MCFFTGEPDTLLTGLLCSVTSLCSGLHVLSRVVIASFIIESLSIPWNLCIGCPHWLLLQMWGGLLSTGKQHRPVHFECVSSLDTLLTRLLWSVTSLCSGLHALSRAVFHHCKFVHMINDKGWWHSSP